MTQAEPILVCVGRWDMYGNGLGNGLAIFRCWPDTGELQFVSTALPDVTVGGVVFDRKRDVLYCVRESRTLPGQYAGGGGEVIALKLDRQTGVLQQISRRPSFGAQPSYISLNASSDFVIVTHHTDRMPVVKVVKDIAGRFCLANVYDDATTALFPVGANGEVGEPSDIIFHQGDGGPLQRQTHPQLHSVQSSPSGKLFLVCDKGNDRVAFLRIVESRARLEVCDGGYLSLTPGSSPRYSAFHPTLPYVFINHETDGIVTSCRYADDGRIEVISTKEILTGDHRGIGDVKQSDLKIDRSGRFLYSLIRGLDLIAVFAVEQADGRLSLIQNVAVEGVGPRGAVLSPDGRFLYVAALESHEITTFAISGDGRLSFRAKITTPNPGSIAFM